MRRRAFTLVELPVVSGRKGGAFTLVELLVVVTIIALLVGVLIPSLSAARSLARAAICAGNLHQIYAAFRAAEAGQQAADGRASALPYPPADKWPGVPANVCDTQEIYICPEEEATSDANKAGLEYWTDAAYGLPPGYNGQQGRFVMGFERSGGCQVRESGDYVEYRFDEDWWHHPGAFQSDGHDGTFRMYTDNRDRGVLEMYWQNCYEDNQIRHFGALIWIIPETPNHSKFYFGASITNYGINSEVSRFVVAPDTVVLLDYDRRIADPTNPGELSQRLQSSKTARHLGKVNVLRADGSVRRLHPSTLDPAMNPASADLLTP